MIGPAGAESIPLSSIGSARICCVEDSTVASNLIDGTVAGTFIQGGDPRMEEVDLSAEPTRASLQLDFDFRLSTFSSSSSDGGSVSALTPVVSAAMSTTTSPVADFSAVPTSRPPCFDLRSSPASWKGDACSGRVSIDTMSVHSSSSGAVRMPVESAVVSPTTCRETYLDLSAVPSGEAPYLDVRSLPSSSSTASFWRGSVGAMSRAASESVAESTQVESADLSPNRSLVANRVSCVDPFEKELAKREHDASVAGSLASRCTYVTRGTLHSMRTLSLDLVGDDPGRGSALEPTDMFRAASCRLLPQLSTDGNPSRGKVHFSTDIASTYSLSSEQDEEDMAHTSSGSMGYASSWKRDALSHCSLAQLSAKAQVQTTQVCAETIDFGEAPFSKGPYYRQSVGDFYTTCGNWSDSSFVALQDTWRALVCCCPPLWLHRLLLTLQRAAPLDLESPCGLTVTVRSALSAHAVAICAFVLLIMSCGLCGLIWGYIFLAVGRKYNVIEAQQTPLRFLFTSCCCLCATNVKVGMHVDRAEGYIQSQLQAPEKQFNSCENTAAMVEMTVRSTSTSVQEDVPIRMSARCSEATTRCTVVCDLTPLWSTNSHSFDEEIGTPYHTAIV